MREKLACALALSVRPDILMLDEPTGPLDPTSAGLLEEELARTAAGGCAIIMSCHHALEVLEPTCVLKLENGALEQLDGNVAASDTFWKSV